MPITTHTTKSGMPDQQKRETPTKSRRPITSTNTSKPARKFVQQNKCPDTKPHHHHTGSNKAQHQTKLALTIGTLLSSQRTDAHPSRPFDRLGGNLRNITRHGPQCQPARPDPAWLVTEGRPRPSLGAVSYTHLRAHETDSYLVCRL